MKPNYRPHPFFLLHTTLRLYVYNSSMVFVIQSIEVVYISPFNYNKISMPLFDYPHSVVLPFRKNYAFINQFLDLFGYATTSFS